MLDCQTEARIGYQSRDVIWAHTKNSFRDNSDKLFVYDKTKWRTIVVMLFGGCFPLVFEDSHVDVEGV